MSRHSRFRQLDSMRALAALSVVLFHTSFRFAVPHSPLNEYLTQRIAGPPITAVVLFFLISGFVLYRPFVEARFAGRPLPPLVPYAVRRVARIVPGYWVALALVSAWLGYSYMLRPHEIVRYFGFLQLYSGEPAVGGGISVAWTLCIEVTFYAALPLLALAARALGRRLSMLGSELALLGLMSITALGWQLVMSPGWGVKGGAQLWLLSTLPGQLDLFAAGMLLAVLSVEDDHSRHRPTVAFVDRVPWLPWVLGLAVLYAEGQAALHVHGATALWMSTHALKLAGCLLLLIPLTLGDQSRGLLRRALAVRPLVWLGAISYGIYLWHKPILEKLAPQLIPHGEIYSVLAVTSMAILAGALSYYCVERPSQRLARRWLANRATHPAASVAHDHIDVGAIAQPDSQ